MNTRKRILAVGGVAGGASCAARARRLSEDAEIIVFERGPYVSFANCRLPYYIGDIIQKEDKLLVATAELFKTRFNIEVRTESEVVAISVGMDPAAGASRPSTRFCPPHGRGFPAGSRHTSGSAPGTAHGHDG
jgi:hypothetical protein